MDYLVVKLLTPLFTKRTNLLIPWISNFFPLSFSSLELTCKLHDFLLCKDIYVDFVSFCSPGTSVAVSSILLALVMAGRAAFVFPLSFLSNLAKKSPNDKIGFKQQVCCPIPEAF